MPKENDNNDNDTSEVDDNVNLEVRKNTDVLNWLSKSESELDKTCVVEEDNEITQTTDLKEKTHCPNSCVKNDPDEFKLTEKISVCETKSAKKSNNFVEGGSDIVIEEHELLSHNLTGDSTEEIPDNNEYNTVDFVEVSEENELAVKNEKDNFGDYEKLLFRMTASRHGISISSPEKRSTISETAESSQSLRYESSFLNFQKTVNDISSIEGSQSDVGDAFRLKASQSGILVQDPREGIEISTDSDCELNQINWQHNSKKDVKNVHRKRHTSTPDHCYTTLDPNKPEFKPRSRERAMSCELRAEAAEFKPVSQNSSFSLNTSISGSDLVPVLEKPVLLINNDHIPLEQNEEELQQRSQIDNITVLKEATSNTNVTIQASPSTCNVGTSTDVHTETDVGTNTELHIETDIVDKSLINFSTVATNTELLNKISVGTQHFEEMKEKTIMKDIATMTESVPELEERCEDSAVDLTHSKQIIKNQGILMEAIGQLQVCYFSF